MAYEQRDNSGSLFKNDKKETDNHPNATGKAMIGGVMYYVSAWTKDGAKGKFQSLAFKPIDGASAPASTPAPANSAKPESAWPDDDDIPF